MGIEELQRALVSVAMAAIVLWKCRALYQAAKTKTWDRFTLDVAYIACCGSLLACDVILRLCPHLRAPHPWRPSNLLYAFRFPGNLLLLALCEMPFIILAERQIERTKKQRVQTKG